LISGLQLPNFIFYGVQFFAELPESDCKICLVKNKIFAVSPQYQDLNKLLMPGTAEIWRAFCHETMRGILTSCRMQNAAAYRTFAVDKTRAYLEWD
jgi:hypothetical protein